jgi:hypothetical protein
MDLLPALSRGLCAAGLWLLAASTAHAVVGVNPFGVNVRSSGPSTVFLTFQALDPGEQAAEAFWCGELRPDLMAANPQLQLPVPVQSSNPCVPGTVYGRLPAALDRSRRSSSGAFTTLTDIMTIPASVARRAYQDAQAGQHSAFFYVRRFVGPAGDRFVVVTCRMGGGGARTPLALLDVRLAFDGDDRAVTVLALERGQPLPRWSARLQYNGSGVLRGRWELVQPGDPEPDDEDLLTAATLPIERRLQQRRWRLVERFELFLPPTGELMLTGPDPARVPTDIDGPYKLLLRVEASDDKEAASNTGGGRVVAAGGVAAFPLPVLRYYVGSAAALDSLRGTPAALTLLSPAAGAEAGGADLRLSWVDPAGAVLQRLEIEADGKPVWSAYVKPGIGHYQPPPFALQAHRGQTLRWRVLALDEQGRTVAHSDWRGLALK